MKDYKFIDLFAGIGGFHQAMNKYASENNINVECVFASEIDDSAINTYRRNYGINSGHDITEQDPKDLPHYDILLGGFPCQAFSKAGKQEGFKNETKGTLFFEIERLLQYRVDIDNPVKYVLLENVSNLDTHDKGRTIKIIYTHLKELGYVLPKESIHMSPHQLGIPQLRNRIFIPAIHKSYLKSGVENIIFELPSNSRTKRNICSMDKIKLDKSVDEQFIVNDIKKEALQMWGEFYEIVKVKRPIIGFPIWAYSFVEYRTNVNKFNRKLKELPEWKQSILNKNIQLFEENRVELEEWLLKYNFLKDVIPTHKKFEWQAGNHIDKIEEGIIQFRPSGLRVKRPTEFPALVAMVHVPIIFDKHNGWRQITPKECARLQSFPNNFKLDKNNFQAYKQFGNSVNVDVVKYCIEQLFNN